MRPNVHRLAALLVAVALASASAVQASTPYSLKDDPFEEPLDTWVDQLIADMHQADVAFSLERHQLIAHGQDLCDLAPLAPADAAHLFDLLDVHFVQQEIGPISTRSVYEVLLARVDACSPDWKSKLRNLRTLRHLFPDGGANPDVWQSFAGVLTKAGPSPVGEYLVINRVTGTCTWIEVD